MRLVAGARSHRKIDTLIGEGIFGAKQWRIGKIAFVQTLLETAPRRTYRIGIRSVRARFRGYLAESPDRLHEWWVDCASHSLAQAESASARHERDPAWNALHDAERFLIF